MILLLGSSLALAASLDNLEMAGMWGSPAATDGAAVWWNPAGLAMGEGTRILIEGAPTFAVVDIQRADPHGGSDQVRMQGVVPFAGLATDLGVKGLGLGLGVGAPYLRGGEQTPEGGPVRYHLRQGQIMAAAIMAGGGYSYKDKVALGGGVQILRSSWQAKLDKELMPDLADEIKALGEEPGYTDADLEDPAYATTLDFEPLSAWGLTASLGLRVQPDPKIALSFAWISGAKLTHTGGVDLSFSCPPQSDLLGRFGAESRGLCDARMKGDAAITYALPSRIHGSVQLKPTETLTVEAMGGLVFWGAHDLYEIEITGIAAAQPELPEDTVELIERPQSWARDNQASPWVALDVKGSIKERLLLGARVMHDRAAVPDEVLLANNYDANDTVLSGLVAGRPARRIELGLSWSHHFLAERVVGDSAFSMAVEPEERPDEAYNWPHGNGSYRGAIDRVGLSARFAL